MKTLLNIIILIFCFSIFNFNDVKANISENDIYIEMPPCTKDEDLLDVIFVSAYKDDENFYITIIVKNLSETLVLSRSEITIIIFDLNNNVYNHKMVFIPRLNVNESIPMLVKIERNKKLFEIELNASYKINYVEIEEEGQ